MNRLDDILNREDEFNEYIKNVLAISVRLATAASILGRNPTEEQIMYVRDLGIEALRVMGVEA